MEYLLLVLGVLFLLLLATSGSVSSPIPQNYIIVPAPANPRDSEVGWGSAFAWLVIGVLLGVVLMILLWMP